MNRKWPYTSEDLRYIAEQIDKVSEGIAPCDDLPDGDWRWGLTVDIFDDGGDLAGQMKPYGDGWIGFYPREVSA